MNSAAKLASAALGGLGYVALLFTFAWGIASAETLSHVDRQAFVTACASLFIGAALRMAAHLVRPAGARKARVVFDRQI